MSETKFCMWCGVRLSTYKTHHFDQDTGEPVFGQRCENPACRHDGCDNTGGHKFNTKWFSSDDGCIKCGHVPTNY